MIVELNYLPIIGLEVHVELKTNSKMFCSCSAEHFLVEPNTHTCPVCLGLPGALPVPNKKAIKWCLLIGLALDCEISDESKFDRKNYFYPDLPKGYQISQYDMPFCRNGYLKIKSKPFCHSESRAQSKDEESPANAGQFHIRGGSFSRKMRDQDDKGGIKLIRINRVHMEEDTAKLIHQFGTQNSRLPSLPPDSLRDSKWAGGGEATGGQAKLKTQNYGYTLIDFNRSGVPLVEIVSEPDISSSEEAVVYLKKLQQIIRYLGVSDCDMEKGSMRCEANISLLSCHPDPPVGGEGSSANARKKYKRNYASLDSSPAQWQAQNDKVLPLYKVEIKNLNSFRFVKKAIEYEIERQRQILLLGKTPIQETRGFDEKSGKTSSQRTKEEAQDYRYFPEPDIPPFVKRKSASRRIKAELPELPDQKIERFMKEYGISEYNAEILAATKERADYFEETLKEIKKLTHSTSLRVNPELAEGLRNLKIEKRWNAQKIANLIINKKVDTDKYLPAELIKILIRKASKQITGEEEIKKIVKQVLKENSKAVDDYKKGKKQVIGFLIGQVMRELKGKGNPKIIKKYLISNI